MIAAVFVIYKVIVLNIVWTVNMNESGAWPETVLLSNAVQVIEAESQTELLHQSYFLIIPLIVVLIAGIIIGKKRGRFVPSKKWFIIGQIVFFLLLLGLHELFHRLAFPAGSDVHIGIIKANFSGYVISTSPMNFIQCILYYLLSAFVLGILPLLIFVFNKEKKSAICWFGYGFAMIGLIQTTPDWFALFPILQQVPYDAMIQMSGWHTYWYLQ